MVKAAITEVVKVLTEDAFDEFRAHRHIDGFGEDKKAAMFEVFRFE